MEKGAFIPSMSKPKIVVIGTASVIFGPGIVRDILVHPSLRGSDVVLVDIDAQALEDVLAFGQRLNQIIGANCRL